MYILGISSYYHDSAACLIKEGRILAACQEERFSRTKHDASFPERAIKACFNIANCSADDISLVTFYEKPLSKFDRILESFLYSAPKSLGPFLRTMPVWLKERLWIEKEIRKELNYNGELIFVDHHESHAASAFFPSPYDESAILTLDGVGEWKTVSKGLGQGNKVKILQYQDFPHSLGLLYSSFTAYLGFKVNSGEHKMMGLSSFGKPGYVELIYSHLIDLKEDGSFRLNMDYFDVLSGRAMTNERFHDLFSGPPRSPDGPIGDREKDLACSIQHVTEEVVLHMARSVYEDTGSPNLCLGGGVALNCVANGRVSEEGPFDNIWVQPAAGDSGGALGAALAGWHGFFNQGRPTEIGRDLMEGSFLGPTYIDEDVEEILDDLGVKYQNLEDGSKGFRSVAQLLAEGEVIGWFRGRMEYGPRALGHRSILADPRIDRMADKINKKIKFREPFRPFAPAVLAERADEYFHLKSESPYMLLTAKVRETHSLPAVTHVDGSARIQTVSKAINPDFYDLIKAFDDLTGCPVVLNTSLNVRGEPIVGTPLDALRCFDKSGLDILVLNSFLIRKEDLSGSNFSDKKEEGKYLDSPSVSALRRFGLSLMVPWIALFSLSYFRNWPATLMIFPSVVFMIVAALTLFKPLMLDSLHGLLGRFGKRMARFQTRFLMGMIYFIVICPFGVVMRFLGWDPFRLKSVPTESYWRESTINPSPVKYRRLF